LVIAILIYGACKPQTASNGTELPEAQKASTHHWVGTYASTLPCADCAGIEKRLTLNTNMTYHLTATYLGETAQKMDKRGNYSVDQLRTRITLEEVGNTPSQFLIGKNRLTQLDMSGNPVTGGLADKYHLPRVPGSELISIRWGLIELLGKHMRGNPAYLTFDTENGLVRGFGWCNALRGSFEIPETGNINFGQLVGTTEACIDSTLESQLINLFPAVQHYDTDAQVLTLYRVKEHPLAKFRQTEIRLPQRQK
jgi:uncharacterized lipoprotein NlpE involved in copper resistance/heat shock protein HslJ